MSETVQAELRLHGIVLARPFGRAAAAAALGTLLLIAGWPWSLAGAACAAIAAVTAVRGVWRWERTRVVVTNRRLVVVEGTLRRREATVALGGGSAVEVEQSLAGRLLGYGTICAGELEVPYVPDPRGLVGGG